MAWLSELQMVSVVFINLELGIRRDGEMKLTLLQSVFVAICVSTVKFEGELCTHSLWVSGNYSRLLEFLMTH